MPENEKDTDKEYEIGYGRPPKHTRFKPGQSGNPKGRPKKTKDLEKLFDRELSGTLTIRENGEVRTITRREAIVKKIVNEALKGDPSARQIAVQFMKNFQDIEGFEIDPAGQQALEAYLQRQESRKEERDASDRGDD